MALHSEGQEPVGPMPTQAEQSAVRAPDAYNLLAAAETFAEARAARVRGIQPACTFRQGPPGAHR
jgi:hypothetical protein